MPAGPSNAGASGSLRRTEPDRGGRRWRSPCRSSATRDANGVAHLGIDRAHGLIRTWTVTHAAAHDGGQLGGLLDPANTASGVWADTAYRSAANLELLARRGRVSHLQHKKPRGRPMPRHIARGNVRRGKVRAAVEHVFAAQKRRLGLVIRTIGIARTKAKIGLANLAYNFTRFTWLQGRGAPA